MDGWLGLACVVRSPLALLPADVAPPIMEASSPARRCAQRSTPSPPASRDRPSARSATAVFPTAGGGAVERLGVGCGITPDQAVRKALLARRRSCRTGRRRPIEYRGRAAGEVLVLSAAAKLPAKRRAPGQQFRRCKRRRDQLIVGPERNAERTLDRSGVGDQV